MKNFEARKKILVLQQLPPKERAVAIGVIKILDKIPKKNRKEILLKVAEKIQNNENKI